MATKSLNSNLHRANKAKKDEFYTQLIDIEKELKHYKDQFRGKVVYCNCDDPFESNFFKYFAANFNALGLKKLITTSFTKSPIAGGQLPLFEVKGLRPKGKEPFKIELNEVTDSDADGAVGLTDVKWLLKNNANIATSLKGNGDFRSEECVELLKEADIVVTNPPFSLFREYVAQIIEHNKRFLIIGSLNAITYKECFRFIKDNKMWLGITMDGRNKWFRVPNNYPINENVANSKIENGEKYLFVKGCVWFTNLDTEKRHEKLILYKKFTPDEYPKYDNYGAINVDKVSEIPVDYNGAMGVPITFLNKYSPDQFEIIGLGISNSGIEIGVKPYKEEHKKYRKEIQKRGAVDGDLYMITNGIVEVPYARIVIKNKRGKK
ncbi:MAG TPA: adenine-specific methyltransferase EcoRI family protein [Patescibacteria group bacterium]|nr:adenine-specific methyltransferase EcoRI family protein [Patescibacteria group bacterium]